ncbi:uncharacterized protein PITG_06029 [Phytophthora infestans T30-4]|uniref:Uncharacterized protein n=1 Tax=Phytophthora infestans (strain T30-4) TaxID=403677 RepID=D0N694_PHYIT|nr:uncharacterized protein PITG_06029 [Phytophthora infestans T30-4]EEY70585.1 conserved hypothetical protein [Phytophthora infestans T30-4]|eukprot:XP_002998239.1 conserved hypothetical protein [Phytophthora infestans T30-4]
MDQQLLVRELLRSRAHDLQQLQDKVHTITEALNDLMFAREELEEMLVRETEAINELTVSVGETPGRSEYTPSYGVLLGQVVRLLRRDPSAQ